MFDFFIEQILGMKWLSEAVWYVLINYFNADQNSNWWSSAHFFFYDTIKITILLVTLIYLISYIQSYFPPEKTKRILTHFDYCEPHTCDFNHELGEQNSQRI